METYTAKGKKVKVLGQAAGWYKVATLDGKEEFSVRKKDLAPVEHKEAKKEAKEGLRQAGVAAYDPERYVRGLAKTPKGNQTLDVDDHAAKLLRGLELPKMYEVLGAELARLSGPEVLSKKMQKELDTEWEADALASFFEWRWEGLNPGMQRMNAGNVLRKALKN